MHTYGCRWYFINKKDLKSNQNHVNELCVKVAVWPWADARSCSCGSTSAEWLSSWALRETPSTSGSVRCRLARCTACCCNDNDDSYTAGHANSSTRTTHDDLRVSQRRRQQDQNDSWWLLHSQPRRQQQYVWCVQISQLQNQIRPTFKGNRNNNMFVLVLFPLIHHIRGRSTHVHNI